MLFDRRVPGATERVLEASKEIITYCVEVGGALSGEHGIGTEKRGYMTLVYTGEDLAAASSDVSGRVRFPAPLLKGDGASHPKMLMAYGPQADLAVLDLERSPVDLSNQLQAENGSGGIPTHVGPLTQFDQMSFHMCFPTAADAAPNCKQTCSTGHPALQEPVLPQAIQSRARLELRNMYGQQAEAFTFTLPLCRGLR